MLLAEFDVEAFIMMSRVNKMLFKLLLKPHQVNAVPYFQRFVLKAKREREDSDQSEEDQVNLA